MKSLNLGDKLKQLRTNKGLTTKQVAEKIGFSQSYISRFENNKAVPDIEILASILDIYDVTLSNFFNDGTSSIPLTNDLRELVDSAKDLHVDDVKILKTLASRLKK
ncbi:MAG: helix-turn-helix domain-containing protein [Tepidibacter sp.]|jgi:transcriptional regulator with XRE-family HTH domain|uniref:helix-turn-helix domain-containing protein n=1 Tax=Tepidibacter sp. TaxID=2529387 RepID=UPI0025F2122B|nr:helix-turn-helix transcriptional regulator [Tepidibacter sp.]MCT4507906.1 helix-turn-helix domain-containing protein [Tepidibacter sp.]MCT4606881.1 helix-turn-helix domain-containing protein [Marinisporobacter sp.]